MCRSSHTSSHECESELTRFTLELSLAIAQAGTAHHLAVFSVAVPLLTNAVVIAAIVTPLCRWADNDKQREREKVKGSRV